MDLNQLTAISPIDGRYRKQLQHLSEYFSEYALVKYRAIVEVEYFLFLAEKKFFKMNAKTKQQLQKIVKEFSLEDAAEIKKTESITNHDVKAVEYFLKEKVILCYASIVREQQGQVEAEKWSLSCVGERREEGGGWKEESGRASERVGGGE